MKASEYGFSHQQRYSMTSQLADLLNARLKHPVWVNSSKRFDAIEIVRRANRRVCVTIPVDDLIEIRDDGASVVTYPALRDAETIYNVVRTAINTRCAELRASSL
jgi:hypothetical protein